MTAINSQDVYNEWTEMMASILAYQLESDDKMSEVVDQPETDSQSRLEQDVSLCALDAENEFLVQEALERLMHGRTVLIIAHRLSTIQSADAVAVMDQHRVMEIGSHAQLLANDQGLFRKLMEKQAFLQAEQKKALYK